MPILPANARWTQNGVTVAGGNGYGSGTNQLAYAGSLFVDDDEQTMVIVDICNSRIMQWKAGNVNGTVVAGGKGEGIRLDQLNKPSDVLIEKETNSLIICDAGNERVVRWSRRSNTSHGEILVANVSCCGVAMDDQRYLYVTDCGKQQVRRYGMADKNGTLVAGGNGNGTGLNQFNSDMMIFVDRQQTVYVSDVYNYRVMKWNKGAREGILIAGGQGNGSALTQFTYPYGLFVDTFGTLYVADARNHRVMRWRQGATHGTVIVGGNGKGKGANQLDYPSDVFFDRHGNLYVTDTLNSRVQRFSLE